jgi:hypothetical protein
MNLKSKQGDTYGQNQVQFQKGRSLKTFLKEYGTKEQCHQVLYQWKWPDVFTPRNGHTHYTR